MPTIHALFMTAALLGADRPMTEQDILDQADARIQRYRTSEVTLKLIPPTDVVLKPDIKIKVEQTRHAFLFGCNIFMLFKAGNAETNTAYAKQFAELFNYATLPFYWWGYEAQRGRPDYEGTRPIAEWCWEHGVRPKGHPLAWNYIDPPWLPDDPDEVMTLQFKRIEQCVERFKGQISVWDVVNEATHYDRPDCEKNAAKLTRAIKKIGVGEYLRGAFRAARKANPKATLIINDYRRDLDYANRVIKELVDEQGKPLYDVIGLQSHQHGGPVPLKQLWEECERFAVFGKPLHWTETTFLSGKEGWNLTATRPAYTWESTPDGEKRQAEQAARFYTVLFSHPAVEAITWWDFSDLHAWQSAPAGLIRKDMTPKPAYEKLHRLIKGKWWTSTEVPLNSDHTVKIRGFFGEYQVTISDDLIGTFSLRKDSPGFIEVPLRTGRETGH